MTKVLVIQGAGMNMRGKVQVEVFGTSTLEDINKEIHGYDWTWALSLIFSTQTLKERWLIVCTLLMILEMWMLV